MTTQRDLERALDTFFEPGADEVADRVIEDALLTIEHTPQRRAMRVPWRFTHMSSTLRLATIVGVVVLAIGGGAWLLGRGPGTGVGGALPPASPPPTASPSPSPSAPPSLAPSPTASIQSTSGWVQFTSSHYGYKIAYPPTWVKTPATRNWVFASDRLALEATAERREGFGRSLRRWPERKPDCSVWLRGRCPGRNVRGRMAHVLLRRWRLLPDDAHVRADHRGWPSGPARPLL